MSKGQGSGSAVRRLILHAWMSTEAQGKEPRPPPFCFPAGHSQEKLAEKEGFDVWPNVLVSTENHLQDYVKTYKNFKVMKGNEQDDRDANTS